MIILRAYISFQIRTIFSSYFAFLLLFNYTFAYLPTLIYNSGIELNSGFSTITVRYFANIRN